MAEALRASDAGAEQFGNDPMIQNGWNPTKYEGFYVKDGGLEKGRRGEDQESKFGPETEQALGKAAIEAVNNEENSPAEMSASPAERFVEIQSPAASASSEQLAAVVQNFGGIEQLAQSYPPAPNESAADWLQRIARTMGGSNEGSGAQFVTTEVLPDDADVDVVAEMDVSPEVQGLIGEMQAETDRNGNPLYTVATIENVARSGAEIDPQKMEEIEAQAKARVEVLEKQRAEIEKKVGDRTSVEFLRDQTEFLEKLSTEQQTVSDRMRYEQNPQMKAYLEKQLAEITQEVTAAKAMFDQASRYFAEVAAQARGEAEMGRKNSDVSEQAAGGAFEDVGRPVMPEGVEGGAEVNGQTAEEVSAEVPGTLYEARSPEEVQKEYEKIVTGISGAELTQAAEALQDPGEHEKKVLGIFEKMRARAGSVLRKVKKGALQAILGVLMTGALVGCTPNQPAKENTASANQAKTEATAKPAKQKNESVSLSEADAVASADYISPAEFASKDTRREEVNGVRDDYSAEYLSNEKLGKNNFGRDHTEDYGDRDATVGSIYQICYDQPEVLAAHVANFPSVLKACGIELEPTLEGGHIDPRIIDDMISKGENGGELQEKLLEAYKDQVLNDKDTEFQFYEEYKSEVAHYMVNMGGEGAEVNPANMSLNFVRIQRNGQKQVRIRVPKGDGTFETIDLNMNCAYQPNFEDNVEFVSTTKNAETPIIVTTPDGTPIVTPENPGTPEKPVEQPQDQPEKQPEKRPEEKPTNPEVTPEITPAPEVTPEPEVTPGVTPTPGIETPPEETLNPKNPEDLVDNLINDQDLGENTQTEQDQPLTEGTVTDQTGEAIGGAVSGGTEVDNAQQEVNNNEITESIGSQGQEDASNQFDQNNQNNSFDDYAGSESGGGEVAADLAEDAETESEGEAGGEEADESGS